MTIPYGWDMRLFASSEGGSHNELPLFTADDAIKFIDRDFGDVQASEKRVQQDRTGTRSPGLAIVPGAKKLVHQASFSRTFRPQTVDGHDVHEVLTNAFGSLSGSTYSIKNNPTDSLGFLLIDGAGTYAEILAGTVVTQWGLSGAGGEAMEQYQLEATRKGSFAATTLETGIDDAITTIILDAPEKAVNAYGITVLMGSEQIQLSNDPDDWTLVAATTWTITNCIREVNGTSAAAHTSAVAVTPAVPSSTTAGVPIGETDNSATWNTTTALKLLEFEVTLETGLYHREHEWDSEYSQGVLAGRIVVSAKGKLYFDSGTDQELPGHAEQETAAALSMVIGSTAGNIGTIGFPKVYVKGAKVAEGSPNEPMMLEFETMSVGSSGDDDIELVIT